MRDSRGYTSNLFQVPDILSILVDNEKLSAERARGIRTEVEDSNEYAHKALAANVTQKDIGEALLEQASRTVEAAGKDIEEINKDTTLEHMDEPDFEWDKSRALYDARHLPDLPKNIVAAINLADIAKTMAQMYNALPDTSGKEASIKEGMSIVKDLLSTTSSSSQVQSTPNFSRLKTCFVALEDDNSRHKAESYIDNRIGVLEGCYKDIGAEEKKGDGKKSEREHESFNFRNLPWRYVVAGGAAYLLMYGFLGFTTSTALTVGTVTACFFKDKLFSPELKPHVENALKSAQEFVDKAATKFTDLVAQARQASGGRGAGS